MPIKVEGIEDLRRILKTADVKIRVAANSEIHKIATDILNQSMALTPIGLTGHLKGSVTLRPGAGAASGPIISQTVEYGGPTAPYALIQHENEKFFHPAKARGGVGPGIPGQDRAAKFLEMPARRHQKTVVPRLIAAIKRVT